MTSATKAVLTAALALVSAPAWAGEAKGTITYQSKSKPVVVTVTQAYMMRGPDVASGKTIRRIVLSTVDIGQKLRDCSSMMCSDGGIGDGMTIDLDAGSRLNYWFVANGQMVQYSGTAEPATLKLTVDTPQRVAGAWTLDARRAGGPLVKVEFDAALVKELKK